MLALRDANIDLLLIYTKDRPIMTNKLRLES